MSQMIFINDQEKIKTLRFFLQSSATCAKENSVTLKTIPKSFNVHKHLVNPPNNLPVSYKQSCLQCIQTN